MGALARAIDPGPALDQGLDKVAAIPRGDIAQLKGRSGFTFLTDPTATRDFVMRSIAQEHAKMPMGNPEINFQPKVAGDLRPAGKSELPIIDDEAKRGYESLDARSARSRAFLKTIEATYWKAGGGKALEHDCQIRAEINLDPNAINANSPMGERMIVSQLYKDNKWNCPADNKNGTITAFAAEAKLLGTPSALAGGQWNEREITDDPFGFAGVKGKPITHQRDYVDAHANPMFAHTATLRLNFALYQEAKRVTLEPGVISADIGDSWLDRLFGRKPNPADLFLGVLRPIDAWANNLSYRDFAGHLVAVNNFNFSEIRDPEKSPGFASVHFFAESEKAFRGAEALSQKGISEGRKIYEADVNKYKALRGEAESKIAQAEAKQAEAEAADRAADRAAQQAANQNNGGDPNQDGNKNKSGGPQKGGGNGADAGQRAQLTPPQDAKIPNQTAFPDMQIPQRPDEPSLDSRLVDLATRGAANGAQLGDLALNPLTGGQAFQGAPGTGAVSRNGAMNFNPRSLLARGIPNLPRGDAPGGAIPNGGAAATQAVQPQTGGTGVPVGKGGGAGDAGALGGNFENGIGYDPNGGEGARQRQTFSEFVSYGGGNDGGSSSGSNGDSGPPLAAQIALGPGGAGESIRLGPQSGKRGAKGGDRNVAAVGILSYVTNLSPLVGDRVKKIEFKEAFAKANLSDGNRDPASLKGVSPSLASPSGLGGRIDEAVRREGDRTTL